MTGTVTVINKAELGQAWEEDPVNVYIGRGSVYGNPYRIGVHGCRRIVVKLYRLDLTSRMKMRSTCVVL